MIEAAGDTAGDKVQSEVHLGQVVAHAVGGHASGGPVTDSELPGPVRAPTFVRSTQNKKEENNTQRFI